jgi:hypothetical protein
MERLEEVTHPKPLADFLYASFNAFRAAHPWTAGSDVSPKSIGREMFETFSGFSDYVKSYGLERSEGVLLRYLSQLYRTLDQTVPEAAKTDEVWDVLGFFRSLVGETDASLLEEWERLRHPELLLEERATPAAPAKEGSLVAHRAPCQPARLRRARPRRGAAPRPGARAEGLGRGRRARVQRRRRPLGRRALRGRDGAVLRGIRRAFVGRRGAPPPSDAAEVPPARASGRSYRRSSTRKATTRGRSSRTST